MKKLRHVFKRCRTGWVIVTTISTKGNVFRSPLYFVTFCCFSDSWCSVGISSNTWCSNPNPFSLIQLHLLWRGYSWWWLLEIVSVLYNASGHLEASVICLWNNTIFGIIYSCSTSCSQYALTYDPDHKMSLTPTMAMFAFCPSSLLTFPDVFLVMRDTKSQSIEINCIYNWSSYDNVRRPTLLHCKIKLSSLRVNSMEWGYT